MLLLNGRIETVCGDITKIKCDAIVNAANSSLLGGGGVDGAIHKGAGPSLLEACRKIRREIYPEGLPTGQAVLTESGRLDFRGIIHTVGPVWEGGNAGEEELLASCYRNSMILAGEYSYRTLAFPAISTGVYAFPREKAALIAFKTLKEILAEQKFPEKVYLVFFTSGAEVIFIREIESLNGNESVRRNIE